MSKSNNGQTRLKVLKVRKGILYQLSTSINSLVFFVKDLDVSSNKGIKIHC